MVPASGGNLSGGWNSAGSLSYDLTSSGILLEHNFFKIHFIGWSPNVDWWNFIYLHKLGQWGTFRRWTCDGIGKGTRESSRWNMEWCSWEWVQACFVSKGWWSPIYHCNTFTSSHHHFQWQHQHLHLRPGQQTNQDCRRPGDGSEWVPLAGWTQIW